MDRKKYRYRYRVTVLVIMIAAGIFFSMKAVGLIFYTSLLIECFGALIVDRPKGWIVPVLLAVGILDGILVVKKLLGLMS